MNGFAAASISASDELMFIPQPVPSPPSTTPILILIARLRISSVLGYDPFVWGCLNAIDKSGLPVY
jgi:hypothetical protein